jgi:hypothetical protein
LKLVLATILKIVEPMSSAATKGKDEPSWTRRRRRLGFEA